MRGEVVSLNVSIEKGREKQPVERVECLPEHGIAGDAHAGDWHRQVSLLASESIERMAAAAGIRLTPGRFAENITTRGVDLAGLPVGARLKFGEVELEVTQIGKECHHGCAIRRAVGDCVMPREGIFARVVRPGRIQRGERFVVEPPPDAIP